MAERLGLTVDKLLHTMTSAEIAEWMAFDQLKNDDYMDSLKSDMMTDEERNAKIDKMLGL
ncbi:MAG: hypothetical protein GY694_21090 [Gammaproteobacteria bacterium]|nr:hypothetical protein [Gammaproteobacteria bacterium]